VAVERWFEVLKEALELVEVKVKTRHVLDKEVTEVVLVHQPHQQAECFLFWHL
jgi:hypothetical protein